ncbi:MAG: single-stranded-DNA-specific exonuclease RecJ [Aerococcaceae bacterium]|nr:single-stranded-DNA-specific exonuclease RecJ [Aerococcaceae bacterium]
MMNLATYDWKLQSIELPDERIQALKDEGLKYSDPFLRLCLARGLDSAEKIKQATHPEPQLFHDAFLLYDMQKAVERLHQAIEEDEMILIYGDYDADGITSTLILYEALEALGANVVYYLPNRLTDGYGPNKERYQFWIEEGVQLILTCDNGIAGHEAIEWAMQQGVDVIVSDHHEIQQTLPPAYAIIHPKHPEGAYPFGELSGAGVALKIATALLEEVPVEAIELAAIGTISDMVSLTDENRTIVMSGLRLMPDTQRIGLRALLEKESIDLEKIDTDTVGFTIGPRLNAIGRLGDPTPALELLKTLDETEAETLLHFINEKNDERKAIVEDIYQQVVERIDRLDAIPPIIIEQDSHWQAGVLGIVASRLLERYQRPVILCQYQPDKKWYKGSGRSTQSTHLFDWLLTQKDCMAHFGGHRQAAGMTILEEEWEAFCKGMLQEASQFVAETTQKEPLVIDLALESDAITTAFIEEVNLLAPFGMDNPKPLFMLNHATLQDIRFIGTNKAHAKLLANDINMIGFSMAERLAHFQKGDTLSFVGELSINEWQNQRTPQLQLKDIGIEGTQWIDCRGSRIQPEFFHYENAVYVFQNQSLKAFYEPKLFAHCQAILYGQVAPESAACLVIVEPPQQIDALRQIIQQHSWKTIVLGAYVTHSKYLDGEPTREEFAKLFRWLQKQTQSFNVREQLPLLNQQLKLSISKLKLMFHVFFEAKFVTIEQGNATRQPVDTQQPIDLFRLPAMQHYRQAMEAESLLIYQSIQAIKTYFE